MEFPGGFLVSLVPLVVRSSDVGPRGSVFLVDGGSIDSAALPATHELDPVERRPAVPRFDKYRGAEIR